MAIYFWYAERDEKGAEYPHLNQASGILESSDPVSAWQKVSATAKKELGNTWAFTIKQFNEVPCQ